MSMYNPYLEELILGGKRVEFNNVIYNFKTKVYNYKGLSLLTPSVDHGTHKLPIKKLHFNFCSLIGTKSVRIISNIFFDTLEELIIKRNCLEESAKITDETIEALSLCYNLKRLSIIYCRDFGENVLEIIAVNFEEIEYLNFRDSIIQADFRMLATLKKLKEVNLSGDSWCKCESIFGLKNLESLEILHIGKIFFILNFRTLGTWRYYV